MKMKFHKTQILVLTFLLSACNLNSGIEESIIIYDANKHELFVNLLKEKDVDFRIQSGGQIFYPVEQKAVVIEAFEKVTGKKIPELQPAE